MNKEILNKIQFEQDYETGVSKHFQDEDPDDWEGSMVFRHLREENDNEDDYDGSLVFRHWNED